MPPKSIVKSKQEKQQQLEKDERGNASETKEYDEFSELPPTLHKRQLLAQQQKIHAVDQNNTDVTGLDIWKDLETGVDKSILAETRLTASQVNELREIFNLVDTDGGGTIDNDELGTLLYNLGIKAEKDELLKIIAEIDVDNTGEIDFGEFVLAMSRKPNCPGGVDAVRRAFKKFDKDQSKQFALDQLVTILSEIGPVANRLSPEEASTLLLNVVPSLKKEAINYETFLNMVFQ